MAATGELFTQLLDIVTRLRSEDGCPWDRQQTPETIKNYILEETFELVDAVERGTPAQAAEEIGDLLFMAVFLARLYEEREQGTIDRILAGAAAKMIRRHPHVFGDRHLDSADEVKLSWEQIKRQEHPERTLADSLRAVPRSLPALMRAYRLLSRLRRTAGRHLSPLVLGEELERHWAAILGEVRQGRQPQPEALGKLLLLLVALSLPMAARPEDMLKEALEGFTAAVAQLEADIEAAGRNWRQLTLEDERRLWGSI